MLNPATTDRRNETDCPPHWWKVGMPTTRYSRANRLGIRMRGDLIETTEQVCLKCGENRTNEVVLSPELE